MSPNRILQIFGTMNRGGAELRTVEMMRHMDRQRFRFDFWAVSSQRGDLDREIADLGGKVYYAGHGAKRWIALLGHLRRTSYDVVHSNVYFGSGLILAIAALAGVPVRIAHFRTTQDGRSNWLGRRLYRRCMRALLDRYATTLLAVSEGAMAAAWGPCWRQDRRCKVIYAGVDCRSLARPEARLEIREEFGFPADSTVVLHLGRIMTPKNHDRLLSIFAALVGRGGSYRLLMAGRQDDGDLASRLRSKAEGLGVLDKVVFAGLRTDVQRLLIGADIMIFPSVWEGMPGAVLEAAAAGIPVLSSDIPGSLEIMRHIQGVQCLSLARSDAEWASTAESMLQERQSICLTRSPVSGTVFDSEMSTKGFADLYADAIGSRS